YMTNNPKKFGMVDVNNNLVKEIIDKPSSTHLKWMWGNIVWEPECTDKINSFVETSLQVDKKELILTNAFNDFIEMKQVYSCLFPNYQYRDLGTYDEIVQWINLYHK
ncbi:MAG: sugar phosphate nucleotidyltransferase, partial [Peptostreptococcaceae bacterium]